MISCELCDRGGTKCDDCGHYYCQDHACVIHTECALCSKGMTSREGQPCSAGCGEPVCFACWGDTKHEVCARCRARDEWRRLKHARELPADISDALMHLLDAARKDEMEALNARAEQREQDSHEAAHPDETIQTSRVWAREAEKAHAVVAHGPMPPVPHRA